MTNNINITRCRLRCNIYLITDKILFLIKNIFNLIQIKRKKFEFLYDNKDL